VCSSDLTVGYLCSEPYAPTCEHGIHPLDTDLNLPWPDGQDSVISAKDAAAPTLADAVETGLLPDWQTCRQYYAQLRTS
jgi:dTDP-4-dehydrorhamnose 3,5-epimerase